MRPRFKKYTQILKSEKINFAVTSVTSSIKNLNIFLQTTQKSVTAAFGLRSDMRRRTYANRKAQVSVRSEREVVDYILTFRLSRLRNLDIVDYVI